ncbi:glycosyltransferase family 4 protein [Chryseobacterium sp.]|uniref:glycosyltransferase family 4 protein n=1 Tax=Chryseobacterium sp. TaxID=1871047 RepID=UPI0011CA7F5D|nr:glycosyltransferase family 4 protein [Chryseobacterium sp.]TXF77560.1 glycosyltransferase family 4 protein [Chryseobacterium sp.]
MSSPNKILHVISISFVINHFFGNQFSYFNGKGYRFYVACTEDEKLFSEAKAKGFTAFPVPIVRSINLWQDMQSVYKLYRFIRKERFYAVIAHSPKGGLVGMLASFLAGTPRRVFFRHGLVFETATGFKRTLLVAIEKFTALLAHKVVNVSSSVIDESNRFRLNPPSKNLLLGRGACNGIDLHKFKPRTKTNPNFIVGFVGRLSIDKGIVELIAAWEKFAADHPYAELHLVGPFDERDPLPQETTDKIMQLNSVKNMGLVADTSHYYSELDVFILPSYREGFGMVILEASASGIPVITTRKTGCVDAIVEDFTGIYTEITPEAIQMSMEYYFQNPEVRKQHGMNGISFIKEFFTEEFLFDEIEKKVFA